GLTNATVTAGNYTLVESWSGYALDRGGGSVVPFIIPGVDSSGHTNVMPSKSALTMWLTPYYSSGSVPGGAGPGTRARLVTLVAAGNGQAVELWTLAVAADGASISLLAQGDSGPVELL